MGVIALRETRKKLPAFPCTCVEQQLSKPCKISRRGVILRKRTLHSPVGGIAIQTPKRIGSEPICCHKPLAMSSTGVPFPNLVETLETAGVSLVVSSLLAFRPLGEPAAPGCRRGGTPWPGSQRGLGSPQTGCCFSFGAPLEPSAHTFAIREAWSIRKMRLLVNKPFSDAKPMAVAVTDLTMEKVGEVVTSMT